jgi:hypothetical protein
MTDRMVVIRTFANEFEAGVAKLHLDGAGIPSQLLTDGLGGVHPHLQFARGVRLAVPASRREEAEEALAEGGELEEGDDIAPGDSSY